MNVHLSEVRQNRGVVITAQIVVIAGLLAAAWFTRGLVEDRNENEGKADAVVSILAETCRTSSFAELRRQGLVEECIAAQDGDLTDELPSAVVSDPAEAAADPDVLPDDENATPADLVGPTGATGGQGQDGRDGADATDEQVRGAVNDYFRDNPLPSTPGYERAINRAVTGYLTLNPPAAGRAPTQAEIRDAVRLALLANPPAPGADGTSVVGATTQGCDVVFTLSTGSTVSVGPFCGADGEPGPPPSQAQVVDAVRAYCDANGACRGPAGPVGPAGVVDVVDACVPTEDEYVVDVNPRYDAATQQVTIECETRPVGLLGGGG